MCSAEGGCPEHLEFQDPEDSLYCDVAGIRLPLGFPGRGVDRHHQTFTLEFARRTCSSRRIKDLALNSTMSLPTAITGLVWTT